LKFNIKAIFICFIFTCPIARASQLVEDFSNANQKDTSATTSVWNLVTKTIHPPLVVDYTNDATDNEDESVDVGDGSDGSFDEATYSLFSVSGSTAGNIITIDTTLHQYLQFTNFYLAPGWSIIGTGTNPLWFKVQGSFTNKGTINCSGANGDSVTSSINSVASGGTSRCGGGAGGNGGSNSSLATNGTTGGVGVGGGGAVANTNGAGVFAKGGGGGGAYNTVATSSAAGGNAGTGGAAGTMIGVDDPHILHFGANAGPGGGSGGGGGGAYLFSDANISRGGGGGGGGGVIRISAVGNFLNDGSILALGGNGGQPSVAAGAGSGGAGAGGTIWIQTAGTYTNNGTIAASRGTAGGVQAPGTGNGGVAGEGRTWITNSNDVIGGTAAETPVTNLAFEGFIHYSKNLNVAQSISYDLRNTSPNPSSLSLQTSLPTTSTAATFVAGSSDNFQNDNPGFVPLSLISNLNGKRYFKFKIQLQLIAPQPAVTPATVSLVTLQFDGIRKSNFAVTPSCGYIGSKGEFIFIYSLCGLAVFFTNGRRAKKYLWHHKTTTNL
jgi:hypothetical protein